MKKSRSRSRQKEKKHKDHKKSSHHKEKQMQKQGGREDVSRNWNADKVVQGTKNQPGEDVLDIIRKERQEDQDKLDQWKQRVGYTGIKVKNPLNIYEEIMRKNIVKPPQPVNASLLNNPLAPRMIELIVNDRLGKKERIKCSPSDTVGDLKKLIAAKTGTRADKIRLQRQHQILKDHITIEDYEVKHEMALEMYYN